MKSYYYIGFFIFVGPALQAQTLFSAPTVGYTLAALVALIFLVVVSNLAGNLIALQSQRQGMTVSADNTSLFSGIGKLFGKRVHVPSGADGVKVLTRGFDINLEGAAEKKWLERKIKTFALQPKDIMGMAPIPKLMVEEGDSVQAGTPIFYDKRSPEILFVSPVSGEFVALNRGGKRSIDELVILADREQRAVQHTVPASKERTQYIDFLKKTGGWTLLRQRPFDTIPDPEVIPKNIFVTTFDSAPLAPDSNFIVEGRGEEFQAGLDALQVLTNGKVYLGLNAKESVSTVFSDAEGVVKTYFHGRHPAGNVGVQIHHTAPMGPKDVVWYVNVQDVLTLGRLFMTGKMIQERVVAITGADLGQTGYVRTRQGANIKDLLEGHVAEGSRLISGDVLTGKAKSADGYMGMYDDQLTVVEEGDYYEMFGWLLPLKGRPSVSGTYPNRFFPNVSFKANTNTHGENRAFVVTGEYERLLPMDILVQPLMKAIITNDFERMEGLGLYELSEEDVALCEFACVSKQPLQKILREGLELMRQQS